jgi:hypothetical protein
VRRALLFLILASLVVPLAAPAKDEIERLQVCGASGCRRISDPQQLRPLIAGLLGLEARPEPRPAPFFTLTPERTAGWRETWPRYVYVPEAQLVRQVNEGGDADWWPLTWTEGAHARATRGLTPFPKPVSWSKLHTPAPTPVESAGGDRTVIALAAASAVLVGTAALLVRRRMKPLPD